MCMDVDLSAWSVLEAPYPPGTRLSSCQPPVILQQKPRVPTIIRFNCLFIRND